MRAQAPGSGGLARGADKGCSPKPLACGPEVPSLVIGIGNPLRGDDGIGWRLAALLPARAGLAVRCSQQLTPELAEELAAVERVLFLDAWLGSDGPGVEGRQEGVGWNQSPQLVPPPLQLQELPASSDRNPVSGSAAVWAGADPWGGASHGLSPQALLALSQILYGQAPRAHQLLLPAHCFGHGEGISAPLAGRLGEARCLIGAWIAAGSALQAGGHA